MARGQGVTAAALSNTGGTGYALNDILVVQGGTSTWPAEFQVTGVNAGAITSVTLIQTNNNGYTGNYTVAPTSPVSVTDLTTATAANASFNLTLTGLTGTGIVGTGTGLGLGFPMGGSTGAGLVIGDLLGGQGSIKSAVVRLQASNQIPTANLTTILNSGMLDLNGFNQTLGQTLITAINITGGTIQTEAGTLTLGGNVNGIASLTNLTPATISGNLSLGALTPTFDVQPASVALLGGADDMVISAVISGPFASDGLTKNNTGKLQLTGVDTYTGATTINGGQLLVDGSIVNSNTTVNSSGALGGTGTTGPVTLAGGSASPGDPVASVGKLTTTGTTNLSNGNLTVQLPANGMAGINYDELNVTGAASTGNLTLGGASTLTVDLNGLTATGVFSNVIQYTGTLTGTFSDTNASNVVNATNVINNPNNWQVLVDYTSHPGAIYLDVFGAANKLAVTTQPTTTVAGFAISPPVQVSVEDSFGTVVPTSTASITVAANGPGAFTGTSIVTVSATNGVATFANLVLNTAGSYTIGATSTPLAGATSLSFQVNAAAASQMVFTNTPLTLTAGVTSSNLTIQLEDQFGNPTNATGPQTISLSTTSTGTAVFAPTSLSIAAGSGSASFTYNDQKAGTPTITATDTALTTTTVSQTETVNAAGASKMVFTNTPLTLTAGVTSSNLTIQLEDSFGNFTNATSTQTISLSTTSTGPAVFAPSSLLSIAIGSGSVSFTYNDQKAGTPILTATDSALTTTTVSQMETVNALGASQLVFTTLPQTLTAGGGPPAQSPCSWRIRSAISRMPRARRRSLWARPRQVRRSSHRHRCRSRAVRVAPASRTTTRRPERRR